MQKISRSVVKPVLVWDEKRKCYVLGQSAVDLVNMEVKK